MIAKKVHDLKEIEQGLKAAKEQAWIHQLEDPLYYNSFQKKRDEEELAYWERELKNWNELHGEGTVEKINIAS